MTSLEAVADLIRSETGIVLSAKHETALRSALSRAAPGLDPQVFLRRARDPTAGRALVDRLVDEVTVQESTFARDRRQLDEIDWPRLQRHASRVGPGPARVWSAGCASGEEPYTLAILAAEAFGSPSPPVDVLGTDISQAALARATIGRYGSRAVRGLGPALLQRYLVRRGGGYEVGPQVRRLVRFRRHNLVRDAVPPTGEAGFDLIVCRNVLIYFGSDLAIQVIGSLEGALRPGGSLVLGAADALTRTGGRLTAPVRQVGPVRPPPRSPLPPLPPARRGAQPAPRPGRQERLSAALAAADSGDRDNALHQVASLLAGDPLDADARFVRGLIGLEAGDLPGAVEALRGALYSDGEFALAAFTLGRAYDALGDEAAARRAYERALRTLNPEDDRHEFMLQQVDIGDIAAACRARLRGDHEDPRRG